VPPTRDGTALRACSVRRHGSSTAGLRPQHGVRSRASIGHVVPILALICSIGVVNSIVTCCALSQCGHYSDADQLGACSTVDEIVEGGAYRWPLEVTHTPRLAIVLAEAAG